MVRHPRLFVTTLVLSFALGCANIHDRPDVGGDGTNPDSPDSPGGSTPPDPALCTADSGGSGQACEATGDCTAPLVCLNGKCVGPKNPDVTCDPVEGTTCKNANETCVGGVCVINPGACTLDDECPLGYLCTNGQCVPERDGNACAKPGPGPSLAGNWKFDSKLHLREALPGPIAGILGAAEKVRDLLEGRIDLGLPGIVEAVVGSVVAGIVVQYIPPWAQDLAYVLGDMSDVINDMRVESTVVLEGQPCDGVYRAKEKWDMITFNFRGTQLRVPPDKLPGVKEIVPDEFSARYSCGELFIDRHRIKGSLKDLIRYLLDTVTEATTGYYSIEDAIYDMVDCYGVAVTIDNYVYNNCSFCPAVTNIVNSACTSFLNQGVQQVSQAIDQATVELGLIKRKGIVKVDSETKLSGGKWYGSLAGGDFPGEFTATKK